MQAKDYGLLSPENVIDNVSIQPSQVKEALKSAKQGKSCGHAGLAAEHFIFADESICLYLSMLYSSMMSRGYLPEEFMKSFIVNNYRPIYRHCISLLKTI